MAKISHNEPVMVIMLSHNATMYFHNVISQIIDVNLIVL